MQTATIIRFGAVAMVSRTPELDLNPADWGRLETATIWLSEGLKDPARELVRQVEDEHGVTQADRRFARATDRGVLIVSPKVDAGQLYAGGKALFLNDLGALERVLLLSEQWAHPESGEPMRTCSFIDQMGDEFDVKAACLAPCDDLWRPIPLAPEVLETGKWAGVPREAEPFRARPVSRAPVMDKFDRVAPIMPEDVRLDIARMTENQRARLKKAEDQLASAERRKVARQRIIAGQVVGYGRMTEAEKAERRLAKEAMEQLGQETAAANDRAEVSRGRIETLALEQMRGEDVTIAGDGALRITSRDGLDSLPLSTTERAAALWYRELYERTQRAPKVASWGDRPMGEMRDRSCFKDWGLDTDRPQAVEAKVMAACKNGRGLTALRLVAGEGRTINSISGGKSQNRKLNTEALIVALDVVADFRGLQ
jgi:hypothetical protein